MVATETPISFAIIFMVTDIRPTLPAEKRFSNVTASMIYSITGTGSNSGASTPGSSGGAQNTSGQKITIRFGHGSAESNARHQAALKFKQMVEERTNGQIVVEIFPNEQLGSEATMLQSVQSNIIEMTAGGSGIFASYNPQISILDLPYAFESFEQAWKVLDGDFGKKLVEPLIDQKIRVLAYWE